MSSVTHTSLANLLVQYPSNSTSFAPNDGLASLLGHRASNTGSAASALTKALSAANGTASNDSSGNSYLLDLSPEARAYLTSMSGNGSTTSQGSSTSSTGAGVVLSPVQQGKLTAILQKYKDAPYTETTFSSIQKDMQAAGIGADKLAGQASMRNLNTTSMLLNALNGGDGSIGTIGGSADISAMQINFMGRVNAQWQTLSSDYDPSTDGSKTAAFEDDGAIGGTSEPS